MFIEELIVTQQSLRHTEDLPAMVKFVTEGGIWNKIVLENYCQKKNTKVSPLIQISTFPDGKKYLHDGHHRTTGTWLGGRKFLYSEEYNITDWTYELYLEINLAVGWVTPFDPRTHCRKADTRLFRDKMKQLSLELNVEQLIRNSLLDYAEPRRFYSVRELAENYEPICAIANLR